MKAQFNPAISTPEGPLPPKGGSLGTRGIPRTIPQSAIAGICEAKQKNRKTPSIV